MLATPLAEAPEMLPQAVCATAALMPAEASLVLVRAMRCMLRRTTPEMKSATPPSNARSKRPRNAVRLTELLDAACSWLATELGVCDITARDDAA